MGKFLLTQRGWKGSCLAIIFKYKHYLWCQSVKVWKVANESLFPRAGSCKQLRKMNCSFILLTGTGMGKKAVEQHLKNPGLTYRLNVSHGMKAVGQILFQLYRNVPLEIKSDNAKSIFHSKFMWMGEQSQDFPGEASRILHWEESGTIWKGNKAFPPRWRWGRLSPLLQSCMFPHPETMFRLGSDCSFLVSFGEYLRRRRGLLAQRQPHRSPPCSQACTAYLPPKGHPCKEPGACQGLWGRLIAALRKVIV